MQVIDRSLLGALKRLRDDLSGASLVQFIVILPVLVFLVYSVWAMFSVIIAHQTLCDAAYESARYLQVEGPLLPEETTDYPEDWEAIAWDISRMEVSSNSTLSKSWDDEGAGTVTIWPRDIRSAPENAGVVDEGFVTRESLFNVRVSGTISNPLGVFFPTVPDPDEPDDEPEEVPGLRLTCQSTGFFEGPPFKSTDDHKPGPGTVCPPLGRCTPGPRATECRPPGSCPTPTDGCPACDP